MVLYDGVLVLVILRKFGFAVIKYESGGIDLVLEDELKECN